MTRAGRRAARRLAALWLALAILGIGPGVGPGLGADLGAGIGTSPAAAEPAGPAARLLALVNAYRQAHDLPALAVSDALTAAAAAHTADMAARGYFAHTSPEGGRLEDRLAAAGYRFRFAAENLAGGQETPAEVLQSWRDSPGHDANLLSPAARAAGAAYLPNPDGVPIARLWTLVLAAPWHRRDARPE